LLLAGATCIEKFPQRGIASFTALKAADLSGVNIDQNETLVPGPELALLVLKGSDRKPYQSGDFSIIV
jgi:hypothetical protein